jgi:hypothetical protein
MLSPLLALQPVSCITQRSPGMPPVGKDGQETHSIFRTGQTMETTMRQIRVAVLLTFTVVGLTAGLSLAQFAREPADVSTDAQAMRLAKDPTWSQRAVGQSLVMAQSTAQKPSVTHGTNPAKQSTKPRPNQMQTSTAESMDHYQCLEHCAGVRQSCEGLATIQPDVHIATIGSEENTQWSRDCQNIYKDCRNQCSIDENTVHWKRAKLAKSKNKGQ